jgi:hypothetical protein
MKLPDRSIALTRPELVDPRKEWGNIAGLDPDLPLARKPAHEPFAAEEEPFETAAAQARQDPDVVLQRVFEGDDESGVDKIIADNIDL